MIVACLLHDIGYVCGVLKSDGNDPFAVDASGRIVALERGASDAVLPPHHGDRSKLFVKEQLGQSPTIDAERVMRAIEGHDCRRVRGRCGSQQAGLSSTLPSSQGFALFAGPT